MIYFYSFCSVIKVPKLAGRLKLVRAALEVTASSMWVMTVSRCLSQGSLQPTLGCSIYITGCWSLTAKGLERSKVAASESWLSGHAADDGSFILSLSACRSIWVRHFVVVSDVLLGSIPGGGVGFSCLLWNLRGPSGYTDYIKKYRLKCTTQPQCNKWLYLQFSIKAT